MNSTGASGLQVPASLILRTLGTTFEKGVC